MLRVCHNFNSTIHRDLPLRTVFFSPVFVIVALTNVLSNVAMRCCQCQLLWAVTLKGSSSDISVSFARLFILGGANQGETSSNTDRYIVIGGR